MHYNNNNKNKNKNTTFNLQTNKLLQFEQKNLNFFILILNAYYNLCKHLLMVTDHEGSSIFAIKTPVFSNFFLLQLLSSSHLLQSS